MPSNWDSYRRRLVNIDKAKPNFEVNELLIKHYKVLYSLLVKTTLDEGIFNDAYLKLTYNYNPDKDFIELYTYYFKLLKGAYYRDDKVTNYLVIPIEDRDFADEVDEEPLKKNTDANFIEALKAKIQNI